MSKSRFARSGRTILVLIVAMLGFSTAALAKAHKSSIKLKGPSSNKIGSNFTYKVNGFAASQANAVFLYEGLGPCQKTVILESRVGSYATSFYVKSNKRFSRMETFTASAAGKHYLCAYLTVYNKKKLVIVRTVAHGSASWVNH